MCTNLYYICLLDGIMYHAYKLNKYGIYCKIKITENGLCFV